jgi:acyl carrier protein
VLAAYAIRATDVVTTDDIRGFLAAKLPAYMVPRHVVFVAALPLSGNGKVDRKALPPVDVRHESELAITAPRSPIENLLASIWSRVLTVDRVGIHDNFFELGGHSLLGTQMLTQVRKELQIAVPLRTLFELPTVAELTVVITAALSKEAAESASAQDATAEGIRQEVGRMSDDEVRRFLEECSSERLGVEYRHVN